MAYKIEITRSAARQVRKLERVDQLRVAAAIDALGEQPKPDGCRSLKGVPGAMRIRVGVLRIIYEIHEARVIVVVLKVGHRRDVYR